MKLSRDDKKQTVGLDNIIDEAFKSYDAVFFSELDGILFIYRPLGRKEYKDIMTNDNWNDFDKQDEICKAVLIHPSDFDFDECSAGIPEQLFNDIIEKSCLDPESMFYLLHMNRGEAEMLGSEMTCLIAEAFPAYTVDEIESWTNFKFMKIFAQAEWLLTNIRGVEFRFDIGDYLADVAGITEEELINMGLKEEAREPQSLQEQQEPVSNNNSKSGGMSPEQMKAYKDFIRQHPEFADAMQYDSAFTGMESVSADTTNPALRPGWYHDH
jgi:hypothetical protein